MPFRVVPCALSLLLAADPIAAQQDAAPPTLASSSALAPSGVRRPTAGTPLAAWEADSTPARRRLYSRENRIVARTTLGALGWAGGALLGGVAGMAVLGSECACDDPGLDSFLAGAAVGSVLATSLVVAAMPLRDGCRRSSRFGFALGGASLGTVGGIALVNGSRVRLAGALVVPLSAAFSSAAAAELCQRVSGG